MGTLLKQGDQFIGSHFAPEAFTGQNGGLNPSAIQTNGKDFAGKPLPDSTVAKSIKAKNKAKFIRPDDPTWQQRTVIAAPIKAANGMHKADASAKVPDKLSFGAPVKSSTQPAKRGNAKR